MTDVSVLIQAYGEFWNPDLVDWGRRGQGQKGRLEGWIGTLRNPVSVDVWDQQGIYVLQHDWRVVYVGKTGKQALGARLRNHLTDRHAGRWDSFSWYGMKGITKQGSLSSEAEGHRQVQVDDAIAAFEALLIAVTEPPGNRRRESLPGAKLVTQIGQDRPRPIRGLLEDLRRDIQRLGERMDRIEGSG